MKLKIKKGSDLVSSFWFSDRHDNILVINLNNRWSYKDFKQWKNHLLIYTEQGDVDFVFTGEIPKLEFETQNKEQITFNIK